MIAQQTLNLFIAWKQCRQWSYTEIPHLSSISCALYFLMSWQYILFSRSVCGNCKVRIAGQWLCQHDLYFLFYSSLCCWGLIKVKCSHMTHEVAWLTNASRSLFRSACNYLPLLCHCCDQTCALEAQLCCGNFVCLVGLACPAGTPGSLKPGMRSCSLGFDACLLDGIQWVIMISNKKSIIFLINLSPQGNSGFSAYETHL